MTTAPFADAAHAEAERVARENAPLEYDSIREAFVDAYAAGLQARTHLAAQEPSDAEVEAAARAIHINTIREFDDLGGLDQHALRTRARKALTAARAVRNRGEA